MTHYILISPKPYSHKSGLICYDIRNCEEVGYEHIFYDDQRDEWLLDEDSGQIDSDRIIKIDDDKWGIFKYILTRKGQFTRAAWCRTAKTRKGSPEVKKMTISTVRAGLDYNSLTAVEALRSNGDLPSEPQPLPWGEWLIFPFIIIHKGNLYLRLYPSANSNAKVQYFLFDEEVSYEKVEAYLLASEKQTEDNNPVDNLCFTVKLNDMIELY